MQHQGFGAAVIRALVIALLVACLPSASRAVEYTAFSLKAAQALVQRDGPGWRKSQPKVFNLGGINRLEGFVYDEQAGDLILVGEKLPGRAARTLDDLAVALRVRLSHDLWPMVGLDPAADTAKSGGQTVRWAYGVQDTALGEALFEADYRLKRLRLGLEPTGVPGLRSEWERSVAECDQGGKPGQSDISSRLWFYPTMAQVEVRQGVCVARGLQMSVFTQVLAATVNGRPVQDLKTFKDASTEAWARDVDEHFAELSKTQRCLDRLRGLEELVAISQGLEELAPRPDLSYWLKDYQVAAVATPTRAKTLSRRHDGARGGSVQLSGGVYLTALARRLRSGDAGVLRAAVLEARPSPQAVAWSFTAGQWAIPQAPGTKQAAEAASLFARALFLWDQDRLPEAITAYNRLVELEPNSEQASLYRGFAYAKKHDYDRAVADFDRTITLSPDDAYAYYYRGAACGAKGERDRAIADYGKAIALKPDFADAYNTRGLAYLGKDDYDRAIADFDKTIALRPDWAETYAARGFAHAKQGDYDRAFADCDKAIALKPDDAGVYSIRASVYLTEEDYDRAIADFTKSIALKPDKAQFYINRGVAYDGKGDHDRAIADYDKAIALKPDAAQAYSLRGMAWYFKKDYDKARADVKRCREHGGTPDPGFVKALQEASGGKGEE